LNFIKRSIRNISGWPNLLLTVSLTLSVFTFLCYPLAFPHLIYDDGTYIGRAMHVLVSGSTQKGTIYDHPFFGQIFLAAMLWVTGYPNSIHPSSVGDVVQTVELLWFVPKLLIGMLGVVDTFLLYKISQLRYNHKIAFIASILFAVTPMVWFLRTIFLDSLQLPFLLSSILFALCIRNSARKNNNGKNMSMALLSGVFMGLAIFTKIPVFVMIPLVQFVILANNMRSLKILGLWFIPVILIPLVWPAYALVNGQFEEWWGGVYWQSHRQVLDTDLNERNKELTLYDTLVKDFFRAPILLVIGFAGLVLAMIKKDYFLILWVIPFLIFLYFIGLARDYFLIPILPALCISAARLIEALSNQLTHGTVRKILPFSIISAIAIYGLINIMILLSTNSNTDELATAALVIRYLQEHKNDNLTVIATPIYSWIPEYVFRIPASYLVPSDVCPILSCTNGTKVISQEDKVLFVEDAGFRYRLEGNDMTGNHLRKTYDEHSKNVSTIIGKRQDKIILPQPWSVNLTEHPGMNLIDKEHVWKPNDHSRVDQNSNGLSIIFKSHKTKESSGGYINTRIENITSRPLLLYLDYATNSPNPDTKYYVEIKDIGNNKRYFKHDLVHTLGNLTHSLFIVPSDIVEKPLKFRLGIVTNSAGEHVLTIKRAAVVF
jgi:hypothetical protein